MSFSLLFVLYLASFIWSLIFPRAVIAVKARSARGKDFYTLPSSTLLRVHVLHPSSRFFWFIKQRLCRSSMCVFGCGGSSRTNKKRFAGHYTSFLYYFVFAPAAAAAAPPAAAAAAAAATAATPGADTAAPGFVVVVAAAAAVPTPIISFDIYAYLQPIPPSLPPSLVHFLSFP